MRDYLPEFKQRQRAIWNSAIGYHRLAERFEPVVNRLIEWLDINEDDRVLDIATGTGRTAVAVRRRGATVVAQDLSPVLLGEAQHYALSCGFDDIEFDESDAENLPFPDESFSVVISVFGAIHAPRGDVVGGEMDRLLAPSGKLGVSTWSLDCPLHEIPAKLAAFVSPDLVPTDMRSWGRPVDVRGFISERYVPNLEFETGRLVLEYPDAKAAWEDWCEKYGPFHYAYRSLRPDARRELNREMIAYFDGWTTANGGLEWPLSYLLVRGTRISSVSRLG